MKVHQRRVACKIVIGGVNAKVGFSNRGARHIQRVDNLLKIRGGTIRGNLIGENGGEIVGKGKAKRTAYLTKGNQLIT